VARLSQTNILAAELLYKSIIRIYHLHSVYRLYTRSARVSVQPKIFDTSQSNKNVLPDEMLCNSIKMALSSIRLRLSYSLSYIPFLTLTILIVIQIDTRSINLRSAGKKDLGITQFERHVVIEDQLKNQRVEPIDHLPAAVASAINTASYSTSTNTGQIW
jgi:hypothetical protein